MSTASNVIGWDDVEACTRLLAERLPAACGVEAFDRILAVARGGLVPAGLLAGRLGVKRVESVQVRFYDGDLRLVAPTLLGGVPPPSGPGGDPRRTLLIDELVDSGGTMRYLGALFPAAQRATLLARATGAVPPSRHGLIPWGGAGDDAAPHPVWVARAIPTERWILFPWSSAEDVAAGGAKP